MSSQYLRAAHLFVFLLLLLLHALSPAKAHSQLSYPQSTAPMTCRLGGEPRFGIGHCSGPCDLRAIRGHYAIHASPSNPAATFRRGQRATFKYQRNNHAPGGFVRLTLVPIPQMMQKHIHARNAFHYSCWGARPVVATRSERLKQRFGFSLVGNDGELHSFPIAYYQTRATIPTCIPDGDYILGWTWFGGTSGSVLSNSPQLPISYGYFSDYWSCSFVRIKGGSPLTRHYPPVFDNDMRQFSSEGCMAANDRPGVCTYEPCKVLAKFRKPAPFANGRVPPKLTSDMFRTGRPARPRSSNPSTADRPADEKPSARGKRSQGRRGPSVAVARSACVCLANGRACKENRAGMTGGLCRASIRRKRQPAHCVKACCSLCRLRAGRYRSLCGTGEIRQLCRL